jgi:hypothetical protein
MDAPLDQLRLRAAERERSEPFDVSGTDVIHVREHPVIHRDKAFVDENSPQE